MYTELEQVAWDLKVAQTEAGVDFPVHLSREAGGMVRLDNHRYAPLKSIHYMCMCENLYSAICSCKNDRILYVCNTILSYAYRVIEWRTKLDAKSSIQVESWVNGVSWRELCRDTSLDQGDVCRMLRRTVEALRQVRKYMNLLLVM